MKVLFRLDANPEVGLGHLYRCITVANALRHQYKKQNPEIIFMSQADKITLSSYKQHGYHVCVKNHDLTEEDFLVKAVAETSGDVVIIDKLYPYTAEFIKILRKKIKVLMLHNLCEGGFYSDVFVLPAAHIEDSILQDDRWNNGVVKFYQGKEYIVVNEKIKKLSQSPQKRDRSGKFRIVVSTGGGDPEGVLFYILEWLIGFRENDLDIVVLVGESFAQPEKLEQIKQGLPDNLKLVGYDPSEWLNADLAICTFGITTYDLMYLGIPSVCIGHIPLSAKRSAILQERYHATVDLGYFRDMTKGRFNSCLNHYIDNQDDRFLLVRCSRSLIDGGGAERISGLIYQLGS